MASALDGVVLAILLVAFVRGLFRGLIREAFSIGALAGACLAVRYGMEPLALWLQELTGGALGSATAPWISGVVLAVAAIALVSLLGRLLRRGSDAVGLGFVDRVGGGALGAAEGALVAALILVAATWIVGRDHPLLAQSKSLDAFEGLQVALEERGARLPDVAAPAR